MNVHTPIPVYLSIVIPAYNEENRIGDTLRHIETYLARQSYRCEVIVVDDGSEDGTAFLVKKDFPKVRVISYRPNRGKGYAVRAGMLGARGKIRVFYDADGSTPIEELEKLWPVFESGADAAIGSRAHAESLIHVRQHRVREFMGRVFNGLAQTFVVHGFSDTQCGFKAFRGPAVEKLFHRQRLDGFCFDTELLYIARKHTLRVEEVPVRWANEPRSHVHMVRDSFRMFRDLFRIRWNDLVGRYR